MKAETPRLEISSEHLSSDEWRARKLARREKQREANAGRALKMRTMRLAHEVPLNFADDLPQINVGC